MHKTGKKKKKLESSVLSFSSLLHKDIYRYLLILASGKGAKTRNNGRCNYGYGSHKSQPNKISSELQFTDSHSTNGPKLYQKIGNEYLYSLS